MRLSESLESSEVSSCQRGVLIGEDSCGFEDHVNEDDDKLKTFTIQEEDQKSILIIGGIKVFLPNNQEEASAHDESAAVGERQPVVTIMMKEKISKAAQGEEGEHTVEILTQWEIELRMLEDWLDNPEPTDDCQK
jgi:hypothetical protein